MSKSFTSIAYCARSESRFFHLALARLMKARFHSEVHLYCGSPQEVEFYESQNSDGVFTSVTDSEFIRNKPIPEDMADAAIFERARSYEEKYHRTYNFLTVNNRHLGRGYMLGGFYHPRSRQSEIPYNQMVYMYNQGFEFWENEFETKNITLCLNGSPIPSRVSVEFGVPFRIMTRSRLENLHYWAWNEFYESPEIRKAFDSLSSIPEIDLDQPYHGHRVARSRYMKSFSARMAVHNIAMTTARHVYWNMRGYAKAKGYYYTEQVKHTFRRWSDYRKVSKIATTKLTDLEGKPFVFFPLHIEPEMALQGLSPEYFFQQAAIASISRDLPVGMTLAVKEAYGAIGRRPDNFYDQIAELKNVVLLDTWEIGLECVLKSIAVATICGSAGFEGAAHGKPVITFGAHNIYNILPHVLIVGRDGDLPELIQKATSEQIDHTNQKNDGKKMLAAMEKISFDMRSFDYADQHGFEQESLDDALECLARSISEFEALKQG